MKELTDTSEKNDCFSEINNADSITDVEFDIAVENVLYLIRETSADDLALEMGLYSDNEIPLQETIQLVISGQNVSTGRISSRLFATIMGGFQNITDSIGNALANATTEVGKIPYEIQRQTDFQIINMFAGSFGIELMAEVENCLCPEEALISQTLNKLFILLNASDDNDMIFDEIAELGSRTLKSYKAWLKDIQDSGIDLEIERKNLSDKKYRWKTDRAIIPKVLETLNSFEEPDTTEINIQGLLSSINIRKDTFELIDVNNAIVSGKGLKDAIREYQKCIGSQVNLNLSKTVIKNQSTGKEKIIWFLNGAASPN